MIDTTTELGLQLLCGAALLLLVLPKRYAMLPLLGMISCMPSGQAVIVGPFHFYLIRLLILVGLMRIACRGELRWRRASNIDKAFLGWVILGLITGSILWGNLTGVVNRLGYAYDVSGIYFIFRALVPEQGDIFRIFRQLAYIAVPVSVAMIVEKSTGQNLFYVLGGVPQLDDVRDGIIRARAVFGAAILAGTFGATLLPYFVALWRGGGGVNRFVAFLGLTAATAITITSGSSGPVMTYAAAVFALLLWRIRFRMRAVRWGIVLMLLGLQAVMKGPVWWAISHISIFSGNTAWYRSNLIDKFVTSFTDWWLVGTRNTEGWGTMLGTGNFRGADITNMFIRVGVDGGLFTLIVFIIILVRCFRGIGIAHRAAAANRESLATQFAIWALGAALFAHIVAFFDVNYFDQNLLTWALLIAMISWTTKLYPPGARQIRQTTPTELLHAGIGHEQWTQVADLPFVAVGALDDPWE